MLTEAPSFSCPMTIPAISGSIALSSKAIQAAPGIQPTLKSPTTPIHPSTSPTPSSKSKSLSFPAHYHRFSPDRTTVPKPSFPLPQAVKPLSDTHLIFWDGTTTTFCATSVFLFSCDCLGLDFHGPSWLFSWSRPKQPLILSNLRSAKPLP